MPPNADSSFRDSGDVTDSSIEWDPNAENQHEDSITDETQLEKFIQTLQVAQRLAHKWEKERAKITMRPRVYTKNTPRMEQR